MTMTPSEIINLFVAHKDDPRGLDKPVRIDGFLYASNGHIAVRIDDDSSIEATDQPKLLKLREIIKTDGVEFSRLRIDLPAATACKFCRGLGMVTECEECGGSGDFDYGSHNYTCKECDGDGVMDFDGNSNKECSDCNGSQEEFHQPIALGNAFFQRCYLAKLLQLDGIQLQINAEKEAAHIFKFDHGVGVIMPTRK